MKRAMKKYDVLMICLIVFSALFILWILLSVLPKNECPDETDTDSVLVYALPSVESVFEQWKSGEIEYKDLVEKVREKQTDAAADVWLTLEDLPIYELNSDYLNVVSYGNKLEDICAAYPVYMAVPLDNNYLHVIYKLKQGEQIIYGYLTFLYLSNREYKTEGWHCTSSSYITEVLPSSAFSTVKIGDPISDVIEICPSMKYAMDYRELKIFVKEGVWFIRPRLDSDYAEGDNDYRIENGYVESMLFIPYNVDLNEFLKRENRPKFSSTHESAYLFLEYMILPE